jgi:2-polyprenyl-3-methyl-5-hydroxy-6-metoxy-1,4-benzoquinol methylase
MVMCNICGGPTVPIKVKEQMLGMNELFTYYQCQNRGHTHLHELPSDLSKYYDTKEYYSFKKEESFADTKKKNFKTILKKISLSLRLKNGIGYSAALKAFLSIDGIKKDDEILDYGCGSGHFVKELNTIGYINARGFDPFLPENIYYNNELYLTNQLSLLNIKAWDVITLNHVFEHLVDPITVLTNLRSLLKLNGKLLLRFPIIDSYAFEKYKENWVQFDAPRHANLFTRKSIQIAVEKATGFKIENIYDDSFHFQFTGSELYLKKLSLQPQNNNRKKRLLSPKTYQYHFFAKKLNKQNKGDQLVVILERT